MFQDPNLVQSSWTLKSTWAEVMRLSDLEQTFLNNVFHRINAIFSIHDTYDKLGEACIKCVYGWILRPHVLQGFK